MRRTVSGCLLAAACAIACGPPKPVRYTLPQLANLPIGARATTDERAGFARVFCGVLPHTPGPLTGGQWGDCAQYLHVAPGAVPIPAGSHDTFLGAYRVLIVGGIFARCLDVEAFQDASVHLLDAHRVTTEHLPVWGNGSSEQNALEIQRHLLAAPADARYIVVGHSKGGVDLLEALVHHPALRPRVVALVTVASPVAGSRLVDGVPDVLKGLALRFPQIGSCPLGDGLGQHSLSRHTRQTFLANHLTDVNRLRSYAVAAVSSKENTSRILHRLWDYQARFSLDQDSHVIADDAVLPGARLLAQANGDHWAVASPIELTGNTWLRERADRNRYPRAALLEAVLRFVAHDLARGSSTSASAATR